MARAWIVDLWVKDGRVMMPDGSVQKIAPTAAQLKAIKTLPEQFRTAKYGRGKRWRLAWYEDQDGVQVQRAQLFAAKKDAELMQAELEDSIRSGKYIDPAKQDRTFGEAAETWLNAKHSIKDSSYLSYRNALDTYVLPRWGTTRLGAITREDIDVWVRQLSDGTAPFVSAASDDGTPSQRTQGKLAPATVRHIVGRVFGTALRYVVAQRWLGENPLNGVELPRVPQRDLTALPSLSYAEAETLAERAKDVSGKDDDRVLIYLLVYGGLRVGEATALTVAHFQHEQRRVRVAQTWTLDKEGKRVLGSPKGHETRLVPLPGFVADAIAALVKDRQAGDFIVQSARGEAINDHNWRNRVWFKTRNTVDAATGFTIHDLRHVAATLAIGAGADVKLVQTMLGHKDATQTLNTYAALWADNVDEVARKIEARREQALQEAAGKTATSNPGDSQ